MASSPHYSVLTVGLFAVISVLYALRFINVTDIPVAHAFVSPGFVEQLPYPWKKREIYYYPDLSTKMKVIFELGDCMAHAVQIEDNTIAFPADRQHSATGGSAPQVLVSSFPVADEILRWWREMPPARLMRVDPHICDVVYTKRLPIFNNTGCQLPFYMSPAAPRCQTKYLKWACELAKMDINDSSTSRTFILPEADHRTAELPPQPYLVTANNAMVSACGQLSLPCGMVHTNANCKATGYAVQAMQFRNRCPLSALENSTMAVDVAEHGATAITSCLPGAPFGVSVYHYDRIFVVAEVDDTYIYHTHLEIMPRLIYHLDFLKANPDIKILFGCDAKKNKRMTEAGIKQGLQAIAPMMKLVGLSMDRLVLHRHVYAREVYLPMEGGCQDPVYNTWLVLTMRKLFLKLLNIKQAYDLRRIKRQQQFSNDLSSQDKIKPVMLLLKRSSSSRHTRNGWDLVRQWNEEFTQRMMHSLQTAFPEYNVVLFSDKNSTLMQCYECQIRSFASAKVLIGVHGAGLGNMLYMEPNGAVVEIAPYGNDGRCLLGGGPFSRLATVLSHSYMMHQPPYEEFKWITADKSSQFDVERFVLHVKSFLISIGFTNH